MSVAIRLTVATLIGSAGALALLAPAAAQQVNAANSADALETIIVTAQKRSEDVQTVPMSITTISQEELARQGATQLADFAGYIPGLQFFSLGLPGQAQLSLRGIPPLGASSTVATYLDETPLGSSGAYNNAAATVLDMLPYDVQSFEVLRGPQGTLYGASSLGGLIKYVTRIPDLSHYSVHVGGDIFALDGADKAGLGGRISVNVPLLADKLAMTASFSRENTPGYIDNAVTGARHQNDYSQQAARVALLWKPNEDLSVTVSGIQQKIIASNNTSVALTPGLVPVFGNFRNDNHIPERLDQTFNYFSATIDYDLGWADLVSATSYSNTRTDQIQDATLQYGVLFPLFGFPAGESGFYSDVQLRKTTEELRLTSKPGEHVEWLAGVFYTHENSQNNQLATAQLFDGTPIVGLNPLATAALPSIYREYAGFGDFTYKFNRLFDVSGGMRWAHNSQDFEQISAGSILPTTATPGNSTGSVVTYSASPRLHITDDTMAYVRVASGYQPGGPNVVLPGVPATFNADKLTNYELGLKTLLAERRLQLDAATFYIKWKDIQVLATNGVASYLTNGGTASSKGLELSALVRPVDGLRLNLNTTYTDATLTQDVPSVSGLSGDRLPFIPKWAASATADYAFLRRADWTARVGGGVRYTGSRDSQVTHNPQNVPLKSYSVLDLNTELANERWTLRLYAKNVTNKLVYTSDTTALNGATGTVTQVNAVPLQPRTIGLSIDASF